MVYAGAADPSYLSLPSCPWVFEPPCQTLRGFFARRLCTREGPLCCLLAKLSPHQILYELRKFCLSNECGETRSHGTLQQIIKTSVWINWFSIGLSNEHCVLLQSGSSRCSVLVWQARRSFFLFHIKALQNVKEPAVPCTITMRWSFYHLYVFTPASPISFYSHLTLLWVCRINVSLALEKVTRSSQERVLPLWAKI